MSRHIQILLEKTDTSLSLLTAPETAHARDDAPERGDYGLFRSALQSPELSRAKLDSVLRKAGRKQRSKKAQKTYWSAFMSQYVSQNANSNELAE